MFFYKMYILKYLPIFVILKLIKRTYRILKICKQSIHFFHSFVFKLIKFVLYELVLNARWSCKSILKPIKLIKIKLNNRL